MEVLKSMFLITNEDSQPLPIDALNIRVSEQFPVRSAVPRQLSGLRAVGGLGRLPDREEGVQRHRRTEALHIHR